MDQLEILSEQTGCRLVQPGLRVYAQGGASGAEVDIEPVVKSGIDDDASDLGGFAIIHGDCRDHPCAYSCGNALIVVNDLSASDRGPGNDLRLWPVCAARKLLCAV